MGRPIITTDAPGCRETVQHGKNGFLIPVKNVPALVNAMEQFIRHPELIEKMGKVSRQIAVEKYDVHKVNALIMKRMDLSHELHEYT
jgi:glycosyltransferase involved in cell wall biosynthesis